MSVCASIFTLDRYLPYGTEDFPTVREEWFDVAHNLVTDGLRFIIETTTVHGPERAEIQLTQQEATDLQQALESALDG